MDFLELYDEPHSQDEERFIAIGAIRSGVIVVVFTFRYDEVTRILSARKATKQERGLYETYSRHSRG